MAKVPIIITKYAKQTKLTLINLEERPKANLLNNPCLSPCIMDICLQDIHICLGNCTICLSADH